MSAKNWVTPILVGGVTFAALYAVGEAKTVQVWMQEKGFGQHLKDLQVGLNAIVSSSMTTIVAFVKRYLEPNAPPAQPPSPPLPPAKPGRDWRTEYHNLYARAKSLIEDREKTKAALEDELFRKQEEVDERRARMKVTLYCGLVLALGSCITTVLTSPARGSSTEKHTWALVATYAVIAFVFSLAALVIRGAPKRRIPILMFGVAAIYVNTCALLISDRKSTRLNSSHLGISY